MATGYARWFQQAYRRCQRAADNCSNCRQSLCQTADHFERWWDLLLQHSVRQAEHQQWGMLFQFSDGTVYQHNESIDWLRALNGQKDLAQANAVLDSDWHNEGLPAPPYAPVRVTTNRSPRRR